MLKKLTTAAGMVLLASSFALAGQGTTKPIERPRAAEAQRSQSTRTGVAKKHHKHHKKHHAPASRR